MNSAQTATLRLNSSIQVMESFPSNDFHVNARPANNNAASSSAVSRFLPRKNPANLFRPQRKPVSSIYSIDVPKDTLYLRVDHGKVSPIDPAYDRDGAHSPVSSISAEDSTEIHPPVPLKGAEYARYKEKHERRTSSVPRGLSAKAKEWTAPTSRFSWTTQATSQIPEGHRSPELPDLPELDYNLRAPIQSQIPGSRFSWTTFNTDASAQLPMSPERSPDLRDVPEHDVPRSRFSWTTSNTNSTPAKTSQQPPSPPPSPPSVLHRARPISRPDAHLNVVKRKPTPSEAGILEVSESPVEIDGNKVLPLSPPEMASIDIITSLQAQINELERRRFNLEKAMKATESLQLQNPVVHDLAKRRADKDKITRLDEDLSETRRKEHELGLKLHRALKRRDQEEPSGLWVRRVTS